MRGRKKQRGNAFIEFALAFTFLFPALIGTFQFGRNFFLFNELANAVRSGARYAGYRTYDSASATPSTAFANDVKNMVVFGNPAGGTRPVVAGLALSHVQVTPVFVDGVPAEMRVSINGYQLPLFTSSVTLRKPVASFPYIGVYAPY